MRRRLWAMILALTFMVGMIPSAVASETVSEVAPEFRSVDQSAEGHDTNSGDTAKLYIYDAWWDWWFSNGLPAGNGWHGYFTFHAAEEGASLAPDTVEFQRENGTIDVTISHVKEDPGEEELTFVDNLYHIVVQGTGFGTLTVTVGDVVYTTTITAMDDSDSGDSEDGGDSGNGESNSCGPLSFMYVGDTGPRDMSEFPNEIGETLGMYLFCGSNDLSGGAVSSSDPSVVRYDREDAGPGGRLYFFTVVGAGTTILTYTKANGEPCSAEVTISGTPDGPAPEKGNFATVGDYTIGFSMPAFEVFDLSTFIGFPYPALKSNNYIPFHTMEIAAATTETVDDGTVVYKEANSADVSLYINKTWIEVAAGGVTDIISFSDSELVTEKTGYSDCMINAYMKEGYTGEAKVFAEVAVTIGSAEPVTVTVSCTYWPNVMLDTTFERPEDDTVEDLNQFLAQLVTHIGDDTRNVYKVVLASKTYEGTIVLPDNLEAQQIGIVGQDDGSTVVEGAIDLKGKTLFELDRIAFKAPQENCAQTSDGKTSAIFGGSVINMYSCTFAGYEVAVDSNRQLVTVSCRNAFVDNEIAVRMDMTDSGGNRNPWEENLFIRNGTAVQILGMSVYFTAYDFRTINSDFIGNGVDFDVRCAGTFYFQRDYFGQLAGSLAGKPLSELVPILVGANTVEELGQVVSYRPAKIEVSNGAKVIANPRWERPVKSWGTHGTLPFSADGYVNFLTSDWEQETQIVDVNAKDLIIDSSAFDIVTEDKKVIDVVDENENAIGTWIFD